MPTTEAGTKQQKFIQELKKGQDLRTDPTGRVTYPSGRGMGDYLTRSRGIADRKAATRKEELRKIDQEIYNKQREAQQRYKEDLRKIKGIQGRQERVIQLQDEIMRAKVEGQLRKLEKGLISKADIRIMEEGKTVGRIYRVKRGETELAREQFGLEKVEKIPEEIREKSPKVIETPPTISQKTEQFVSKAKLELRKKYGYLFRGEEGVGEKIEGITGAREVAGEVASGMFIRAPRYLGELPGITLGAVDFKGVPAYFTERKIPQRVTIGGELTVPEQKVTTFTPKDIRETGGLIGSAAPFFVASPEVLFISGLAITTAPTTATVTPSERIGGLFLATPLAAKATEKVISIPAKKLTPIVKKQIESIVESQKTLLKDKRAQTTILQTKKKLTDREKLNKLRELIEEDVKKGSVSTVKRISKAANTPEKRKEVEAFIKELEKRDLVPKGTEFDTSTGELIIPKTIKLVEGKPIIPVTEPKIKTKPTSVQIETPLEMPTPRMVGGKGITLPTPTPKRTRLIEEQQFMQTTPNRLFSSQLTMDRQLTTPIPKLDSLQRIKQTQISRQKDIQIQRSLQKAALSFKTDQIFRQKESQAQRERLRLAQPQISVQAEKLLQRQGLGRLQRAFRDQFKPKKPIKFPFPTLTPLQSAIKKVKGKKLGEFEVFVKKRGIDINIGKAKTVKKASTLLKKELGQTLSASGFIQRQGKRVKLDKLFLGKEFRPAKRNQGRIVEKRKYRLDSPSEILQIKRAKRSTKKRAKKIKWF